METTRRDTWAGYDYDGDGDGDVTTFHMDLTKFSFRCLSGLSVSQSGLSGYNLGKTCEHSIFCTSVCPLVTWNRSVLSGVCLSFIFFFFFFRESSETYNVHVHVRVHIHTYIHVGWTQARLPMMINAYIHITSPIPPNGAVSQSSPRPRKEKKLINQPRFGGYSCPYPQKKGGYLINISPIRHIHWVGCAGWLLAKAHSSTVVLLEAYISIYMFGSTLPRKESL